MSVPPPPPGWYEEKNRLGELMTKINTLELALREQDITINELEVKLKIATMVNKTNAKNAVEIDNEIDVGCGFNL